MRVDWRVPERAGQLSDSQVVALAPRIALLRAEPDTLRLDVTDSVQIGQLVRVLAIDDSGSVLGEVRRYDFDFRGGLHIQPSGFVKAQEVGTGVFGASISRRAPGEFRTRGPAQVWVLVTDSTGAIPAARQITKGSASISGIVRDSAGQPLAGATVQAIRRVGSETLTLARGFTNGTGAYRLDSLPAGPAMVIAIGRGHEAEIADVEIAEGSSSTRDIRLLRRRSVPIEAPRPRP